MPTQVELLEGLFYVSDDSCLAGHTHVQSNGDEKSSSLWRDLTVLRLQNIPLM